jgi:ribosomal protein L44E
MPNRNCHPQNLKARICCSPTYASVSRRSPGDDPALLFAYRRKIAKELGYDERSKPMVRRRLKTLKRRTQNGTCPLCSEALPDKYAVLDRLDAAGGYTEDNTRLICEECDRQVQAQRAFR